MPLETTLLGAGRSGALYRQEGSRGYLWTGWDGRTRAVDLGTTTLKGDKYTDQGPSWLPGGTDVLVHAAGPGVWAREDLGTGERITFTLPEGHAPLWGAGGTVLTRTGFVGSWAYHLFTVGPDGVPVPVSDVDVPATASVRRQLAADARTLVVEYPRSDGSGALGLIDLETGAFTEGPRIGSKTRWQVVLTPDRIAWSDGRTVGWVPRDNPTAPAATLDVPLFADESLSLAAAGDDLLVGGYAVAEPNNSVNLSGYPVRRVGFDGAPPVTLQRHAAPAMVTAADGGAVFAGGADSSSWALRKSSVDGGESEIAPAAPVAAKVSRISLANGRLATWENDGSFFDAFFNRTVTQDGASYRVGERTYARWASGEGPLSTGDGRSVRTDAGPDAAFVQSVDAQDDAGFFYTQSAKGAVLDATGRYVVVNGTQPARQYVGDIGTYSDLQPIRSRPVTAASVWGYTYWTQSATAGQVVGEDLRTGAKTTLATGSGCVAKELQAVGRWLYWSCGSTGPAGVYDRTVKRKIAVPSGEALVGDGYLVRHDRTAGKLLLTDFRNGAATRTVGELPATAGNQRGVTWTVDKFGGPLAYIAADRRIHLVPSGVPTEPFSLVQAAVPTYQRVLHGRTWQPRWVPSKPAASWRLTLRDARTGAAVRTLDGGGDGPTGGAVHVSWDGRDDRGLGVASGVYRWSLTAVAADGSGGSIQQSGTLELYDSAVTTVPGTYEPLTPTRTLDTRTGLGAAKAKVGAGKAVSLQVAGVAGVPATGVTAVVLNVTATNPTTATHVSVYPPGRTPPDTSNLNVPAGRTVANAVVVPVVGGKVNLLNHSGSVDLLADVAGYYTEGSQGSAYRETAPARLMDTRAAVGVPKARVGAKGTVTLQVAGRGGVPASGATAVVLNLTATAPTLSTYVTAYPSGTARTSASSLNVTAGRTVSNLVTVPLVDGKVAFYNHAGAVDLLADVAGYFTDAPAAEGGAFTGVGPVRVLDSRSYSDWTQGKIGSGRTVTVPVGDFPGVPAAGTRAVVLNVTATEPTAPGYLSVYPSGAPRPSVSNVNFAAGQTVPNLVVVPVGQDGKITFYNHSGSVHLVVDAVGYFGGAAR
ncbi:FlgD immunoglobulin-like domain containing protein [Streptomyces sp. NPDC051079]|uniref:FlgD immunoglobulin-like domain containing protein n=1 Tax=Streptomyces sp. NPDC051079 TaxID=3155043 RepID=UPI00344B0C07